jgi:hypothetical protein
VWVETRLGGSAPATFPRPGAVCEWAGWRGVGDSSPLLPDASLRGDALAEQTFLRERNDGSPQPNPMAHLAFQKSGFLQIQKIQNPFNSN